MKIEPENGGVNIVLLGKFNPAVYTPAWFVMHDLLPLNAAKNSNLQIAHNRLTQFTTEWLKLSVHPNRFQVATQFAPYVRLRDLVIRIFSEQLSHIPISAFGINRDAYFDPGNQENRHKMGARLAPSTPWGNFASSLELENNENGLTSLVMRQSNPKGRPSGGQINIRVELSRHNGKGENRVYVDINDHYRFGSENDTNSEWMNYLKDDFDNSIRRANEYINHLIDLATSE